MEISPKRVKDAVSYQIALMEMIIKIHTARINKNARDGIKTPIDLMEKRDIVQNNLERFKQDTQHFRYN